eukprot:1751892-Rhodomonas_salina.1
MSCDDYKIAKKQMQEKLHEFEAAISKEAKKPGEISKQVKTKHASFRAMAADLAQAAETSG